MEIVGINYLYWQIRRSGGVEVSTDVTYGALRQVKLFCQLLETETSVGLTWVGQLESKSCAEILGMVEQANLDFTDSLRIDVSL